MVPLTAITIFSTFAKSPHMVKLLFCKVMKAFRSFFLDGILCADNTKSLSSVHAAKNLYCEYRMDMLTKDGGGPTRPAVGSGRAPFLLAATRSGRVEKNFFY